MYDTYVTIVGNVLTAPEWRRTTQTNTLVANFKVASTARRLDRDSGRWVDGNSLRVRVNCWRKLAEGVASSVMVGDPVVVAGRLYTRDWIDDAGNHRTLYELEAVTVGHDLARGRGRFLRNRPTMATSTVEDAEAESRVHGEPTERVPGQQAPTHDDRALDDDFELPALGVPRHLPGFPGSVADLGPDPFDEEPDDGPDGDMRDGDMRDGDTPDGHMPDDMVPRGAVTGSGVTGSGTTGGDPNAGDLTGGDLTGGDLVVLVGGGPGGGVAAPVGELDPLPEPDDDDRLPSVGRQVPGPGPAEGPVPPTEPTGTNPAPRGRRGRGRQPVPA
ncbi:single-stranded DNA-binding protein [Micromonospora cathayae]|uniref:Single-stranded DNA-binding protein n=1 Tax=Micromonospora cathayae TaxID=3028804 RepID=A0ABY7ZPS3_9ACTN|nr:single-stranded DNA-binding protein [Micromonospora sp. HUAS 3]WDZ84900.1 single-stranded DNA-binding protein [Micromonospora sp. HUAS 3]